jgi:excisionase family DNA binding protein
MSSVTEPGLIAFWARVRHARHSAPEMRAAVATSVICWVGFGETECWSEAVEKSNCARVLLGSSNRQFSDAQLSATLQSMQALGTRHMEGSGLVRPLAVRVREACRLTGIGRSKLYELIRAGEISTFKIGNMTLISTAELDRFLAAQMDCGGQQWG